MSCPLLGERKQLLMGLCWVQVSGTQEIPEQVCGEGTAIKTA